MSEFEYLAVFVSIIFGISLTHILAGAIRSLYRGVFDEIQLVFTGYVFVLMLINWWTAYSWQDQEVWTFDEFLVIIIWSVTHYLMAITLYPPQTVGIQGQFEYRQTWFLWASIGNAASDMLQTFVRGEAFSPWYYLPFASHYVVLALLAIFVKRQGLTRWIAWYFVGSMTLWSLVVRRFLI
jgi:hypothetical protein